MKLARLAAFACLLALVGCGPLLADKQSELPPLKSSVVDEVVEDLLDRMATRNEAVGPEFVNELPDLKDSAAADSGFKNWLAFKAGMNRTSPDLEVKVAEQITRRIRDLLETSGED